MKKIPSVIFVIVTLPVALIGIITGTIHFILSQMWYIFKEAHKDVKDWIDNEILKSFKT